MSAPTQEFPPWLTPSAAVGTDAAGDVVTSITIVYLPLTYLGPSIPLNSLYTYGGSTEPPTLVTGFASATVAPPATTPSTTLATSPTPFTTASITTIAIPTISTSSPTASASGTSIASTATASASLSTLSGSVTSSPTSLSTIFVTNTNFPPGSSTRPPGSLPTMSGRPPSSSAGVLSRGQLVGVIVASILGLIFLFVFLLAMWLWCKGRRNRRSEQFFAITPIDDDYFIVGEETRTPGEGSPRHSGEEADPFLQRSHGGGMHETTTEMGSRPGVPRVPPPPSGSLSSAGSSSTSNSGYGVLLERPTLGILPPTVEEGEMTFGGYHLSEEEMRQLDRESVLPQGHEEGYTGAYAINKDPSLAPPRLVNPDRTFVQADIPHPQLLPSAHPRSSVQSNTSLMDAEGAALLTARRVKVAEIPSVSFDESGPNQTQSGFLGAIGLAGLATLGRMSWFRENTPPVSSFQGNSKQSPGFSSVPLFDSDTEAGRGTPQPDLGVDSFGRRGRIIGTCHDEPRPISDISGRTGTSASGTTVWYDTHTSLPSTPGLIAPPRALTPSEPAYPEHSWIVGPVPPPPSHLPPAYDDPFVETSPSLDVTQTLPSSLDILDLPAPTALTHFASSSSMRDSGTVSSIGLSRNPFPPGLEFLAKGKTWSHDGSISAASSSPAWHNATHGLSDADYHTPIVADILEEEPPNAGNGWRSMASGTACLLGEPGNRRTTFGLPQYTHPVGLIPSEQGSLHSMRSHINRSSIRSTGSAPASHRGAGSQHSESLSSNSSRPSAYSASASIAHSLGRSGSIISDGRRRFDPHLGSPPSAIPFGVRGFQTPPRVTTPGDVGLFKYAEHATMDGVGNDMIPIPSVHFSPGASTIRTVNSGSTAMQRSRTRTISSVTALGAGGERVVEAEYEDMLPLSDVNSQLGSAWMPAV